MNVRFFTAQMTLAVALFSCFSCWATTTENVTVTCAVCGAESSHREMMSTNSFGAPDLDLRPSEMMRSTMNMWVSECPECGYCRANLEEKTAVTREYAASKEYRSVFPEIAADALAVRFLREIKGCEKDGAFAEIPLLYLCAAWDCDDLGNAAGAVKCRRAALETLEKYREKIEENIDADTLACLKTDVLRRVGDFSAVQFFAEEHMKKTQEEVIQKILAFQIEKCRVKNSACFTVSDALGGDEETEEGSEENSETEAEE